MFPTATTPPALTSTGPSHEYCAARGMFVKAQSTAWVTDSNRHTWRVIHDAIAATCRRVMFAF